MQSDLAAVEIKQLSKTYPGNAAPAIDDLTLSLAAGKVHALLGANGAGKTTLIRILTTLTRPTSGTAHVLGHDVVREGAAVRSMIGLVGQQAAVDERLSGRANLLMFGRLHGLSRQRAAGRAEELLDQFGLSEAASRVVSSYSGGMRRRLDLAVGIITRPHVLLVDEPTTGLDPQARRALWADLRLLVADGTTVLLTTQYLDEADGLADHVVILREGRAVVDGPIAEVRRLAGEPRMKLREPSLEDVYLHLHESAAA